MGEQSIEITRGMHALAALAVGKKTRCWTCIFCLCKRGSGRTGPALIGKGLSGTQQKQAQTLELHRHREEKVDHRPRFHHHHVRSLLAALHLPRLHLAVLIPTLNSFNGTHHAPARVCGPPFAAPAGWAPLLCYLPSISHRQQSSMDPSTNLPPDCSPSVHPTTVFRHTHPYA